MSDNALMNIAALFIYLLNLPLQLINRLIWRFGWKNDTP